MADKNSAFIKFSWFVVGMTMLVVLAGGIVRMSQSGMGCPDWPKCFGMWIPPTEASQLPDNYQELMAKQDIDHSFNVYHTWIEYINRLLGAILGLVIIGYLFSAVRKYWSSNRRIVWISLLLFGGVAIQGWLGKKVVDANLAVVKITVHMLVAIVLAIIPLINIAFLKGRSYRVSSSVKWGLVLAMILLLFQIVFGTQVREEIDIISKSLAYEQRELWIDRLGSIFLVHRSFSWIIFASVLYILFKSKGTEGYFLSKLIVALVFAAIFFGVVMAYLDMPAVAQPVHLFLAISIMLSLFYYFVRIVVGRTG